MDTPPADQSPQQNIDEAAIRQLDGAELVAGLRLLRPANRLLLDAFRNKLCDAYLSQARALQDRWQWPQSVYWSDCAAQLRPTGSEVEANENCLRRVLLFFNLAPAGVVAMFYLFVAIFRLTWPVQAVVAALAAMLAAWAAHRVLGRRFAGVKPALAHSAAVAILASLGVLLGDVADWGFLLRVTYAWLALAIVYVIGLCLAQRVLLRPASPAIADSGDPGEVESLITLLSRDWPAIAQHYRNLPAFAHYIERLRQEELRRAEDARKRQAELEAARLQAILADALRVALTTAAEIGQQVQQCLEAHKSGDAAKTAELLSNLQQTGLALESQLKAILGGPPATPDGIGEGEAAQGTRVCSGDMNVPARTRDGRQECPPHRSTASGKPTEEGVKHDENSTHDHSPEHPAALDGPRGSAPGIQADLER